MSITDDPTTPGLKRGADDVPVPQNDVYLVLSTEERAKGFVQPVRTSYRHIGRLQQLETDDGRPSHQVRVGGCGAVTTMGPAIAETYARDPWFYGGTFCVTCSKHRPLDEFIWLDGEPMSPSEWPSEKLQAVMGAIRDLER
jgi:hypothetical protein